MWNCWNAFAKSKQEMVTGRHSQGAYTNIRCCSAGVYTGDAIRLKYIFAMLFCWNIYVRCGFAWVYNYVCAVLLEYIRAMLGLATPGSGDPKPQKIASFSHRPKCSSDKCKYQWEMLIRLSVSNILGTKWSMFNRELSFQNFPILKKFSNTNINQRCCG